MDASFIYLMVSLLSQPSFWHAHNFLIRSTGQTNPKVKKKLNKDKFKTKVTKVLFSLIFEKKKKNTGGTFVSS